MKAAATIRFVSVIAMLVATAASIAAHRRSPAMAPHAEKLANFPAVLADWQGKNVALDPEVRQMLGPDGDYLTRIYTRPGTSASPWVDLYIAYFAKTYSGEGIHSPRNCLPGAGWSFLESSYITMHAPGHAAWQTGRYVIANGPARELVLYWYQSGDRRYASEYTGKFYGITSAIRAKRTDSALVRIITPIASGETPAFAEARAVGFAEQLAAHLPRFIPD